MSRDASGAAPDVAVLIVNWNTRDLLAECLQSVADSAGPSVQTVVVDNDSADGSADMVRARFPSVRLLALSENLGFVGGNNRAYGAADAGARYVLLLNPDAVLGPGALRTLVEWMDANPTAGACGPLLFNSDGTLQPSWSRFPTLWSEVLGRQDRRFLGHTRPVPLTAQALRGLGGAAPTGWVGGACLLARRDAVEQCAGRELLDPDFHMYSEETDLCCRLARAGWPAYLVPGAEVVHHSGQSSKQAADRALRLLYGSKVLFFEKHYGHRRAGLLRAAVGAASGLKWLAFSLLALPPSPRRATLAIQRDRQRAVLQALRGE